MNCPICGKEMEPGLMMPNKNTDLTWAPGRWQFPFPRKGKIKLRPPVPRDAPLDLPEYPAHHCPACKTVVFQYN